MPANDGGDGLFEMMPVESAVVELGPVDKTFRRFDPGQAWLVPPSLDDRVPQEHIVRFIADLVDEHLDLSAFYAGYSEGRGAPPFDPRFNTTNLVLKWASVLACLLVLVRSGHRMMTGCRTASRWVC